MRHLLPLLLPALLVLMPARAQADEETARLKLMPATLAVAVKTPQPSYGAPLKLDVTLTNHSRRALPIYCDMSASNNASIRVELIDKQGVVWLPAKTPTRPTLSTAGYDPYAIIVQSTLVNPAPVFRDNVWTVAAGKRLRFTLTLTWFRRKVPVANDPASKTGVPGLPAGPYTIRAHYKQNGLFVPSAKPYWNPRLIQVKPTRPMKVVLGLFQGTLSAETAVSVHAPTVTRTDALNRRVRELERQLAEARALLHKVRELVSPRITHAR